MTIFRLPDLGEGLPDAEISQWYIQEGDVVKTDQPLVSMETAKAIVDVPSPHDGLITRLFGKPGDIIKTGDPLMEFNLSENSASDRGTVVGNLPESHEISEDTFTICNANQLPNATIKATPAVRILAKKLNIDLNKIHGSGEYGMITKQDVETADFEKSSTIPDGYEQLLGVRRTMLNSMIKSHNEIVPVSLFDEADIDCWPHNTDITVRLIQAVISAYKKEPALNAWFNNEHNACKRFDNLNLGLAIDSKDGLFVPVIHDANKLSPSELRIVIDDYKQAIINRSLPPSKFTGATFTISNFGKFSGKFANPIIVPPQVAILAIGKLYTGVICDKNDAIRAHKLLPLSLTFDHRAITGGEASRFLGVVIDSLGGSAASFKLAQ